MTAEEKFVKSQGYFSETMDCDPKDLPTAIGLLEESAEGGYVPAMFTLCNMLCNWKKPQQWNPEKGSAWLERCEGFLEENGGRGNANFFISQSFGDIYATGGARRDRVPSTEDIEKAVEYLKMAVEKGKRDGEDPEWIALIQEQLDNQVRRLGIRGR